MFKHPDAQALFQTILANPDDDAPRLILADWLDEQGESVRAEFIRLECKLDRDKFSDESLLLRQRCQALRTEFISQWISELPAVDGVMWNQFERGFCKQVRLNSVKSFARLHTKIRKLAPITHFVFSQADGLADLAKSKALANIRGLLVSHLNAGVTDAQLLLILQSPHLRALHHIACGSTHISRKTIQAIADSPKCAGLRQLELFLTNLWDGVALLGRSPHFTALEELNIHTTIVPVSALAELAQAPVLRTLRRFRLGDPFGAEGVRAIVHSPTLTNLKHFALVRPGEGTQCMQAIAEAKNTATWRELDIMGPIGVAGAEALANAPNLAGLQGLTILEANMGEPGLIALLNSPYLRQLRQFSMANTAISDVGAKMLMESPVTANLEHLAVDLRRVTPTVADALKVRFKNRVGSAVPGLYR
jgi:uncharacterized protein (TIGR02996 family)